MVRQYVAHHQRCWVTLLPALEFAYNSSNHSATPQEQSIVTGLALLVAYRC
jgi:hypothetical protein